MTDDPDIEALPATRARRSHPAMLALTREQIEDDMRTKHGRPLFLGERLAAAIAGTPGALQNLDAVTDAALDELGVPDDPAMRREIAHAAGDVLVTWGADARVALALWIPIGRPN